MAWAGLSPYEMFAVGLAFVFATEFFPFHSDVIQTPWSDLGPAAQMLYLGMMRTEGAGFLAFRIREIARDHGVPIVENKPLARAIYRSIKVGRGIPEAMFQAVAEVLAHVSKLSPRRERAW